MKWSLTVHWNFQHSDKAYVTNSEERKRLPKLIDITRKLLKCWFQCLWMDLPKQLLLSFTNWNIINSNQEIIVVNESDEWVTSILFVVIDNFSDPRSNHSISFTSNLFLNSVGPASLFFHHLRFRRWSCATFRSQWQPCLVRCKLFISVQTLVRCPF